MSIRTKYHRRQTLISGAILAALIFFSAPEIISRAMAHGWQAPKKAAAIENPLPRSEDIIQSGEELYRNFCSHCHGPAARGGSSKTLGLAVDPPDLVQRLKGHSQGDFFWKINRGRRDMPGFEADLEPEEIWQIIRYIEKSVSEVNHTDHH